MARRVKARAMVLARRRLDLAPDPIALGRALRGRPGALLLWNSVGSGPSYVTSDPLTKVTGWDPEPRLLLRDNPSDEGSIPRWFGLLPYEAGRTLERGSSLVADERALPHLIEPSWWRFGAVAIVDRGVTVVGDDAAAVEALCWRLEHDPPQPRQPVALDLLEPLEAPERHRARIERALEFIASGDLYQVNLARRFVLGTRGHPIDLLHTLASRAPSSFSLAFSTASFSVVSTSPELFLELLPGGRLRTSPIKGTRPRHAHPLRDHELAQELDQDPKEQAELAMILDVERNDLGRVAISGSVRLTEPPKVAAFGPVYHRFATIEAALRPDLRRTSVLAATFPSGSVTGAPKIKAMEIIKELEPSRRGLYTGAYGLLDHDGGLRLAMAIRTLSVSCGKGHYFAGGGIVADSDPAREVEETLWKARHVLELI